MGEEPEEISLKQKALFYITAFFILLGTFSLFAFLFLVPFVIEPAFTTIFMEFDENPALCVTVGLESKQGASNCSWSSCREGCTKEVFQCTQIRVNYKLNGSRNDSFEPTPEMRSRRAIRDYDYPDYDQDPDATSGQNDSEWFFTGAKLFPNVKGCGYPPMLNCTIFIKQYKDIGTNFSCYYSRVDPGLVITHLDMLQVHLNLIYALAIPIPSFILSVIYLTVAYFKIYNEDEEQVLLEENADGIDTDGNELGSEPLPNSTPPAASGGLTPGSETFREDLASFGRHFKVAMADDMSRESFADAVPIPNSASAQGSINKIMTTCIPATAGPVADI